MQASGRKWAAPPLKGTAAVAALAAAWLLAGCAPALDWRDWRPEGSGISLLLPCKPVPQVRQVQLAGKSLRLALHACSAGGQTWGLAFADLADPSLTPAALDGLLQGMQENLGATGVQERQALQVPGATPHPQARRVLLSGNRADGQPMRAELATFVRGTLVFQATVLGAELPAEGVETFFESLRFAR